jgi:outer membrane protein
MKNKLIIAFAIIGLGLMAASKIDTDTKKFGYVNSMEILSLMPDMKTVETELEAYSKELDADFQAMYQEYTKKANEYQQKEKEWSEAVRSVKMEEINEMQQRLQKTQQAFEQELVEKQQKLLAPLEKKITDAIAEVAKDKGLSYVFDTSKGLLLYADQSDDISADIKNKLKIPSTATTPGK